MCECAKARRPLQIVHEPLQLYESVRLYSYLALALALAVGEGSPSLASAAAAVSRGQMDDLQATEETSFVAEDVNQVIKEVRPPPHVP